MSVPAFLFPSCTRETERTLTTIITLSGGGGTRSPLTDWHLIETLDVFTFEAEGIELLECYERLTDVSNGSSVSIRSTTGKKRTVILANSHLEADVVESVCRYDDLKGISVNYEDEDDTHPSMSGEVTFTAGEASAPRVELKPFLSEIEISSLDPGELTDIYVYILNAAQSSPVLPDTTAHPNGFLNHSRLRDQDLMRMRNERIIARGLDHPENGTALYCYPNTVTEESAGSPFTRLAIEGKSDDCTRFYSIEIGRPGKGVERGRRYSYRISVGKSQTPFLAVHPSNFIMGRTGEDIHVWCEVSPEGTSLEFSEEDLEFDRERGIYDWAPDPDGRGVMLHLTGSGTGMFCIDAGPPVNDGVLVVIVVDQDHIGI